MFSIFIKKKSLCVYFILLIILAAIYLRGYKTSGLYLPKPRGYIRIELPNHKYTIFERKGYPYKFEYSVHAKVQTVHSDNKKDKYWINVYYPQFEATIHITYKQVNNNPSLLREYWNEAQNLISRHQVKADLIDETKITNGKGIDFIFNEVYGEGIASQCQFYTTDGKNHFIMGSLYFNTLPDQKYLKPMIDFVKIDIKRLLDTFHWQYQ